MVEGQGFDNYLHISRALGESYYDVVPGFDE